jgi:phosphonate transport system ATP-binding protein
MTPAMQPAAVRVDGLVVTAGARTLLHVPRLVIRPGERVALVGPNGAGKSTLLRALAGFVPLAQGEVSVLGVAFGPAVPAAPTAAEWRGLRTRVGQVLQGLHLVPRLTARENVVLGALARPGAVPAWRAWTRLYPPALAAEADAALEALGLAARGGVRADRLSGGERQKVGIARLMLQRPELVLADEPTSALDPAATVQACEALCRAAASATLVTVVHDPSLLPTLADRVVALAGGEVVFDLPVAAVDADRLHRLYTAQPGRAAAADTDASARLHERLPSPSVPHGLAADPL